MVDTILQAPDSQQNQTPPSFALRQQEAACARLSAVAASASCEQHNPTRILRLPEVMDRVGICRASIYQNMGQGTFPKSISLGARAVGWLESEIDAWLAERIQKRSV
jgi:prophage regulatory protein